MDKLCVCTLLSNGHIIAISKKWADTMGEIGWVKFHRKLTDNWLWGKKPFSPGQAWVDLVLLANHKRGQFLKNGQMVVVERGQSGRSEVALAEDWGWSRGKVRRFLNRLETDQMIVQQSGHLTSIISILNYDLYNADGTKTVQHTDSTRYTNKNEKNDNNKHKGVVPADLLAVVNRVTGRKFRVLPERGVKKLLDAFTLDEIETALTALVADDWHADKVATLNVDYFIRATIIDKFLHQGKKYWQPKEGED